MIKESKNPKFLNKMVSFINQDQYEGVCRIELDDEPDEDGNFWIYVVFSKEWIDNYPENPRISIIGEVEKIKKEIRNKVKQFFNLEPIIGSYFTENC